MLSITKVERLKLGRVLQLEPIGKVLAPEIVRDEKLDAPTNTRDQECSSLLNLLIRQARTIAFPEVHRLRTSGNGSEPREKGCLSR